MELSPWKEKHKQVGGKFLLTPTNALRPLWMVSSCMYSSSFDEYQSGIRWDSRKLKLFPLHSKGDTLYSAASTNFLGTESVFQRFGLNPVKTELKRSWLNGNFIFLDM